MKTVVVTGCSSGIGKVSALLLVKKGFQVFAGVRKQEDAEQLRSEAGPNLVPLLMDVTNGDSIAKAASEVEQQSNGLDGLVNVAGIGVAGPVEYVSPEDLRYVFEVDVVGQIAVTQAFLPLLRKSRGRIVNISSVGAHIAIPFGGVLTACKAAFGLLSDALRLELRPFGVRVCTIEPGAIYTPAVEKTLGDVEGVIRRLPPQGALRYGDMLRKFTQRAYDRERHGSSPEVVAQSVHHALTAARPRIRYVVGKGARQMTLLPRLLPDRVLDSLRIKIFGMPAAVNEG